MSLVGFAHACFIAIYKKYVRSKMDCKDGMSLNGIIEIESGERIHVGENVQLRRGVSLCAMKERRHCYDTEIRIGDNVFLNERTKVWATDRITIGNNVMVGPDVLITDNSHGKTIQLRSWIRLRDCESIFPQARSSLKIMFGLRQRFAFWGGDNRERLRCWSGIHCN